MGEPIASKADLGSHRSEMALCPAKRSLVQSAAKVRIPAFLLYCTLPKIDHTKLEPTFASDNFLVI